MADTIKKADSIFYDSFNESNSLRLSVQAPDMGPIEREYEMEKNRKEDSAKLTAGIIYWISLAAAIFGNFIISVILVPFLMMLNEKITLYVIVMIMGVVFGALFNFLLSDIERLDENHHVMTGIVIPALALINIYIMVNVSKTVGAAISITVNQNAMVISIIYVAMFMVPYIITAVLKNYRIIKVNNQI